MKARVQVISQGGKLVAVHVPPTVPAPDPRAPKAYLRAGKGQFLHDLTVESAQLPRKASDLPAFQAQLRKKLKLRK